MKRTQIQLPDSLYDRLKNFARSQETTLSDVLRRAGEYLLSIHPEPVSDSGNWRPPPAVDIGSFRAAESEWRNLANAQR
jgi:hypothetical protein